MKPKNFPARRLLRQLIAQQEKARPFTEEELKRLEAARAIRSKKVSGSRRINGTV